MFDNKKLLSAVLAASMSTMLIPAAAFAETAEELTPPYLFALIPQQTK